MSENKRYFIVNPAGAVHEVTYEHAAQLLRRPGFRPATQEQVKKYMTPDPRFADATHKKGKPIQRFDKPIGEPWNPAPESLDVDAIFAEVQAKVKDAEIDDSEAGEEIETEEKPVKKAAPKKG